MAGILEAVRRVTRALHGVAGLSLVALMLLTVTDVVLRACRKPIPGTYELVGYAGALAIGFALPYTSWVRGHVFVDSLLCRLPEGWQRAVATATRLAGVALFGVVGWHLVLFGVALRSSGEVSPTLQLRFYPVAWGLAAACALEVIVLLCGIAALFRSDHD